LVTDMMLVLVVAGIMTLLCKKLKQPLIIGYILAGFLVGPVVRFIPTLGDAENIETLAEIGVIFMMFSLGLEFDLHKMAKAGLSAIISAVVQVLGMAVIGYVLGLILGWGNLNGMFLGGMLGMSSTIITIKAIEDAGMKDRPFAELAVGTLIIEDILAIFLMLILAALAIGRGGGSFGNIALDILKMLLYLTLWLVMGILLVPSVMKKLEKLMNDETLLVVSLGFCFAMVVLADKLGFSSALGAFMAGSILAGSFAAERVEHLMAPLKDLFVAIFFVSVGLMVIPSTIWQYKWAILLICAVTIVGKIVLLSVCALITGRDIDTAVHSALSQSQVGEFSFIIASMGISMGAIGAFLYPVIVAVAVLTTFATPFLLRSGEKLKKPLQRLLPKKTKAYIEQLNSQKTVEDSSSEDANTWKIFLSKYIVNYLITVVILSAGIMACRQFLLPALTGLDQISPMLAKVIALGAMLLLVLVFLPSLLIFRRTYFTTLWLKNDLNRVPLLLLMALRVATAAFFIALPFVIVFDLPLFLLLLVAVPTALLSSRSGYLKRRYMQIEARFLSNLNAKKLAATDRGDKTIWVDEELCAGTYLVEDGSSADNATLRELDWGRLYNVSLIKFVRGRGHVNIPTKDRRVHAGDVLVLLGQRQAFTNFTLYGSKNGIIRQGEITTLREFIDGQDGVPLDQQLLEYAIKVKRGSPFDGHSMRELKLREKLDCTMVGMARDGLPIMDVHPDFIFEPGDVLWVVGSQAMAGGLFDMGVIG
ncbi:MAG: cation:proton antiporter, partial [Firmicutes bacterium]|nr:cation:proton antiporter [Bacillota bacterium]